MLSFTITTYTGKTKKKKCNCEFYVHLYDLAYRSYKMK